MTTHSTHRRAGTVCLLLVVLASACGCVALEGGGEKLYNSLTGVHTIVVAPVMNLSTTAAVDTIEVTNALASELGQVEGINVVPLGRVYQYLSQVSTTGVAGTVGNAEEARGLAQVFKAQATIVAAVTEYDPYDPPRMGLAVQMYTTGAVPPATGSAGFDPVSSSREAVPFPVTDDAANRPRDMIHRVYSGRDLDTKALAQLYARQRMADGSPYGWRRFLIDQRAFQRLCCYGVIREMLGEEGRKPAKTSIIIGPGAGKWPK